MQHYIERNPLLRSASHRSGLRNSFSRLYRSNLQTAEVEFEVDPELRTEMAGGFREDLLALRQTYPGTFDDWVV